MVDREGARAIHVRRATACDEPAIAAFLMRAYHPWGRYKYPERWQWQFFRNPFNTKQEPPIWLAVCDGHVVGQITNTPVPIFVGQAVVSGVNQGDLIVRPDFRRLGVARALMEAALEQTNFALNVWAAPPTIRILRALGFVELPGLVTLRLERSAARVAGSSDRRSGVAVCRVERFGSDVDRLWSEVQGGFGLTVVRNSEYLNWKFVAQPHHQYALVEARRGERLRGLAVIRLTAPPEPRMILLSELIVARQDAETLDAICQFVRGRYSQLGPIVTATSVAEYREALRRAGFVEAPGTRPVVAFAWSRNGSADGAYLAAEPLIGRADSDWDQYPYAAVG